MLILIYFFLGASLGSFIGLVCDRFPEESIITPRSHCSQCQHTLGPFELIPILSQICLGFKCLHCKSRVPIRYLFMEIFSGGLFLLNFVGYISLVELGFLLLSLCLSLYDLKAHSFPLTVWLISSLPFLLLIKNHFLVFLLFLALAFLTYLAKLPFGEGDFLYLAIASLVFPLNLCLIGIELACLLGLFYYLIQEKRNVPIPFIPFLSFSFLCVSLIL